MIEETHMPDRIREIQLQNRLASLEEKLEKFEKLLDQRLEQMMRKVDDTHPRIDVFEKHVDNVLKNTQKVIVAEREKNEEVCKQIKENLGEITPDKLKLIQNLCEKLAEWTGGVF